MSFEHTGATVDELARSHTGLAISRLASQGRLPSRWRRLVPLTQHSAGCEPGCLAPLTGFSGNPAGYVVCQDYAADEPDDPTAGRWWVEIPPDVMAEFRASRDLRPA